MNWASAVFGAFIGVAAIFGLTALALFPLMRARFLLWVVARTAFFALMAVALFPVDLPAGFPLANARTDLGEAAVAMSVALSGPFLASYLEKDLAVGRMRGLLRGLFFVGLAAAAATLLAKSWPWFDVLHDILLLATTITVAAALSRAIKAGSRVARFQAAAWGPLILVGIVALGYELLTGVDLPHWPEAVLVALMVDFVGTASGIVSGFMVVVRERDAAIADVKAAHIAVATDPLTGIANRRGLALRFRDGEVGRPFGLAVVDCDHFKRINDQYGHDVGDEVLIAVARGLQGDGVFAARQGGEEFVVLFYEADWQRRAEALRRMLTIAVLEAVPEVAYPVTASAGLTAVTPEDTLDSATKRADRALYAAKDAGRDRSLILCEAGLSGPRLVASS